MSTKEEIYQAVFDAVKDDAGKLTDPGDYYRNITAALARYSRHRPAVAVEDIDGDGTHEYDLPLGWVEEFSTITSIEYPLGDLPATLMEPEDFEVYRKPAGNVLRLIADAPAASEEFRVTYTIPRTEITVAANDVDALVNLAASFCCENLANAYAQSGDSTIGADAVNYRSKSADFAFRAKRLMALYKEHVGVKEDGGVAPATGVASHEMHYPGGQDRLTHPARQRRQR
jgi:hypothetical protein